MGHVAEDGECILSLIGKCEGLKEGVPNKDDFVERFLEHLVDDMEEVEVVIPVNEFGGEGGVLVEALQKEAAVNCGDVGCGILVGASEDGKEGMCRRKRTHMQWATMKTREMS